MFVVSLLDEEGKPVTAVGRAGGRGAAEQHRDRLRLLDGWTAHVIPLREPITADVERELRVRRGG